MSATVKMRVNLSTYDDDLTAGTSVVANVFPVKKGAGSMKKGLLVPAGHDVAPGEFEVDPGRYAAEVILPSGRILTDEFDVREGESVTREFDVEDSPQETHAWQYLSGNIEPRDSFWSKDAKGVAMVPAPVVHWLPNPGDTATSWASLNTDATSTDKRAPRVYDDHALPLQRHPHSAPSVELYRLNAKGTVDPEIDQPGEHPMLLIDHPTGDSYLVRLPIPWKSIEVGEALAEVMVDLREDRAGSPIAVTVRDPWLGGALAYLANGSLDVAAPIVRKARDILFQKFLNPLAAAAGGYVLVGSKPADDDHPDYWFEWIENLRNYFKWLPDGAILDATVHLRFAAGNDAYQKARDALLEAYQRGIPWYSVGLSWLIEGLSDFPDDECQSALKQVQRLSWRVDTRQPFLVIRTNKRSQ